MAGGSPLVLSVGGVHVININILYIRINIFYMFFLSLSTSSFIIKWTFNVGFCFNMKYEKNKAKLIPVDAAYAFNTNGHPPRCFNMVIMYHKHLSLLNYHLHVNPVNVPMYGPLNLLKKDDGMIYIIGPMPAIVAINNVATARLKLRADNIYNDIVDINCNEQ